MAKAKAAAGAGSIRKRADGRWEGRVVLGHDPGTGKEIRKSIYGKTQKDVRTKLSAMVVDIDLGTYMEPAKITVGAWMDRWLKDYTRDLKPLTITSYQSIIDTKIKPHLGAVRLPDLNAAMINRTYRKLLTGEKAISSKTLRNIHTVLHAAMAEAVRADLLAKNPVDAVRTPKIEKPKLSVMDDDDIRNFVQVIRGTPCELILLIDLFTGLRRGELLGLTWDCIDFDHNRITVKQQQQYQRTSGVRVYMSTTKNGRERTITVAPSVMQLFKKVRVQQAQCRLANGPIWDSTGGMYSDSTCTSPLWKDLVFTREDGRHIKPDFVYDSFKRAAAAIGKPDLRLHDLRHSYAVASIKAGDDIKVVQHNLGHATAAFTLDVYASAWDSMQSASADRMESFMDSVGVKTGVN